MDAVLFVYSGDCDSLTEIACSDDGLRGFRRIITLEAPAAGSIMCAHYAYFGCGDIHYQS